MKAKAVRYGEYSGKERRAGVAHLFSLLVGMIERICSRSNQNPQALAHEKPSDERRDIVRIELSKRAYEEPPDAYAHALAESIGCIEEVIPGRPTNVGERLGEAAEEARVVLVVWRRYRRL